MKKMITLFLVCVCMINLVGCGNHPAKPIKPIDGNLKTYYQMSDDTWQCDGYIYKYRLEISGRMPNAAVDSTFVYLSNIKDISFDKAWMAAGLSSNSEDYFDVREAVLVEMKQGDEIEFLCDVKK